MIMTQGHLFQICVQDAPEFKSSWIFVCILCPEVPFSSQRTRVYLYTLLPIMLQVFFVYFFLWQDCDFFLIDEVYIFSELYWVI